MVPIRNELLGMGMQTHGLAAVLLAPTFPDVLTFSAYIECLRELVRHIDQLREFEVER